jgi:hypothetical protein
MPPRPLLEQAASRLAKDIESLTDIGTLPYEYMRSVLLHIERAEQLKSLEDKCPQLVGKTGELWQGLIARDWPTYSHLVDNPPDGDWYAMYKQFQAQSQQDSKDIMAILQEKFGSVEKEKAESRKTVFTGEIIVPEEDRRRAKRSLSFNPAAVGRVRDWDKVYYQQSSRSNTSNSKKPSTIQKIVKAAVRQQAPRKPSPPMQKIMRSVQKEAHDREPAKPATPIQPTTSKRGPTKNPFGGVRPPVIVVKQPIQTKSAQAKNKEPTSPQLPAELAAKRERLLALSREANLGKRKRETEDDQGNEQSMKKRA